MRPAAYFIFGGGKETKEAVVTVKPAVFLDVPEVLVNLSNSGGERTQYLKVKIVLELADAALTPQIQTVMPRVMDAFQTYLRELRPTDLDGSAGLYRLKEELTRRVNAGDLAEPHQRRAVQGNRRPVRRTQLIIETAQHGRQGPDRPGCACRRMGRGARGGRLRRLRAPGHRRRLGSRRLAMGGDGR